MSTARRDRNVELVRRYQSGDDRAAEELLLLNEGLVAQIARKFIRQCHSLEFDDLQIEGQLGLLAAAGKFDASRGNEFSTYASWWVRQAIQRAVVNQDRMIRLPNHVAERVRAEGGEDLPTVVSLDGLVGDEDGARLGDLLPAPDDTAAEALAAIQREELLNALPLRERHVVARRLEGETPSEIALTMGCSRANINQVERTARKRLAVHLGG